MTTTTTTLAAFLLERIAEDEAVARSAGGATADPWSVREVNYVGNAAEIRDVNGWVIAQATTLPEHAVHIARHDPARVLAECESKRRIVEEAARYLDDYDYYAAAGLGEEVLRALATVYADHPDFRAEWRA